MSLPGSITERLSVHLSRYIGHAVDIEQGTAIGNGNNDCYRLDTDNGRFFVKVNSVDRFPSLFEAEADGLRRILATGTVRVPYVIAIGEDHDDGYLLLEHIAEGPTGPAFWRDFGRSLAALHRNTADTFGLERDNYIGTLKQVNTPDPDWTSFLITRRLEPLIQKAVDRKRLGSGDALRAEQLYRRLPSLFPEEPPALLHGDLWHGNLLCDTDGRPVLIDPAVYYGHREMDLAMSRLFGGSEASFHAAYNEAWPLAAGWAERVDICNLYPLLVHVNLFGGAYAQQVRGLLKRFG
ncbi:MAG TPA: fructosamine kinase family protein [Flavobacteriales bacterium]